MKLVNTRYIFTPDSTIGKLTVDGEFLCYILEPTDRGLDSAMSLDELKAKKVFGKTAIPVGTYDLQLISGEPIRSRFQWIARDYPVGKLFFPELQNVPDYEAVLLHPGNYPKDTEGCSLVGLSIAGKDFIGQTEQAIVALNNKCYEAIRNGGVTYTLQRDPSTYKPL